MGKLIVLEGVDGSGKGTQTKLLVDALKKRGKVSYFDFPQYTDSVFGQLTGRALAGELGDFMAMSPYLSSLPYMLDRVSAKPKLLAALKKGPVICNRYTTSSLVHQVAKVPESERKSVIRFIETAEYEELGLPRPDLVIFLDVRVDLAQQLAGEKERRSYIPAGIRDASESDIAHLTSAADFYRQYAKRPEAMKVIECADYLSRRRRKSKTDTKWEIVHCNDDLGMLPMQKIHELILEKVEAFL